MKHRIKAYTAFLVLAMILFNIIPYKAMAGSDDELIYPLKEISKLDCRFQEFDTLSSNCKQTLPVLNTKDYNKYATKNGWYNDYTRLYTVLWGASYKYGWDVWSWGHQWTDFATAKGTPVYTIADGTVIEAASDVAWGKYVSIEHTIRWKTVVSNYAHLAEILVKKWEKLSVWEEIWKVWSTGNSTGNHLHFQIDLPSTFHPYYYDYSECPYSYYNITETGVCFDVLAKHTFDPLAFLESNGGIIDEVISYPSATNSTTNTVSTNTISKSYESTLNTTVYYGYGTKSDVKNVQRIYQDLGYYDGKITGDFDDVEDSIIKYQLATWVISSKSDDGAGWFGPKTRTQTKADYAYYQENKTVVTIGDNWVIVTSEAKVEKVSRENLLTREEIEAQEMEAFLKQYDVKIENTPSQMNKGDTEESLFKIENSKGKGYKWNTPGNVNFEYDKEKISIFPETFYNFRDGTRDLIITAKSEGHTTVNVKIGEVIVDTFSISVWTAGTSKKVQSATIYTDNNVTLWEEKTAIVLMKDQFSNKLVKTPYEWSFTLESDKNVLYCVKRWTLADIKEIYKRSCFPEEFTDSVDVSYSDTIEWLLIFDYKVLDNTWKVELKKSNGVNLTEKSLAVLHPKNLDPTYAYYDEVLETLMGWISDWIDRWYFQQDKALTKVDAKKWILNTISYEWSADTNTQTLKNSYMSKSETLTREEFLDLTYTYLSDNNKVAITKEYTDLESDTADKASLLLGSNYSWQDAYGEKYFQPEKEITRWEAAYMLSQILRNRWNMTLVRN